MDKKYILQMNNISKDFPGVKALEDVNFDLKNGEIHALIGENGAGKSTLIKILSGSVLKDKGEIFYNDEKIEVRNTHDAIRIGINTIYQENSLVQELNVAENVFLGRYPTILGRIKWREVYAITQKILDDLSIKVQPQEIVSSLSIGQQQLIEITKALSGRSKIIIMDEPTSSLTEDETNHLFSVIKKITKNGVSIIYISHRLKEIFKIADRVTVLRDGKLIKTLRVEETNYEELVKYMLGKEMGELFSETPEEPKGKAVLEVKNFTKLNKFHNINFDIKEGEILGFFGLVGAGRTEIIRSILGFIKVDEGTVILNDKKIKIKSPKDAYKNGFAYISEDRRTESIIQNMTVRENLTIILLRQFLSKFGLLSYKKEKNFSEENIEKFSIKTSSIEQLAMNLSGGNQQKLAIAKAISTNPRILILDEPARGIDVGSKKEIWDIIRKLSRDKVTIIIVSSETPEIIGMCNRVITIREGRQVKMFDGEDITEENLLNAALGNV